MASAGELDQIEAVQADEILLMFRRLVEMIHEKYPKLHTGKLRYLEFPSFLQNKKIKFTGCIRIVEQKS